MMRALFVAVAFAAAVVGIPAPASADPLPPGAPGVYIFNVHQYTNRSPQAFPNVTAMSDAQLLDAGYQACHVRDVGEDMHRAGVNPFIFSMATQYLCPSS